MLVQLTRAARARSATATLSMMARGYGTYTQTRMFVSPTVSRRADFVQELYLKELKSYKPTPVKDSDAQGQVQTFSVPKTPASPEEADLASSLKEYETMAVEIEGADASGPGGVAPVVEDWLEDEEDDAPASH